MSHLDGPGAADFGSRMRSDSTSNTWIAENRALNAKLAHRDEELARLRAENDELKRQVSVGESFRAECISLQSKVLRLQQDLSELPAHKAAAARSDSFKAENVALSVLYFLW